MTRQSRAWRKENGKAANKDRCDVAILIDFIYTESVKCRYELIGYRKGVWRYDTESDL